MSLDSHHTDPQPTQLPTVMPLQPHDHYKDLQDIDLSEPQRLLPQYFMPAQATHAVMTAQDFVNVPFAELPLYIPGMTQNVEGFDGGINNAALAVIRPGRSNLVPSSQALDSSGCKLPFNTVLLASGAMVELGLNDSV